MKNIRLMIMAAALVFAAACAEKEALVNVQEEPAVTSLTITVSSDDMDTRTFLNNKEGVSFVDWNSADYIYVFDERSFDAAKKIYNRHVFTQERNGSKVTFKCDTWPVNEETGEAYKPTYALFNRLNDTPDDADKYNADWIKITYNHSSHGTNIIASLRDAQHVGNYNSFAGNSNVAVGKIIEEGGYYRVTLQNVCGLIKFKSSEKPSKVTLKGNNNEIIAGGKPCFGEGVTTVNNRIRVCFNEDGTPFWKSVSSDGSREITLTAGDIWNNGENEYYICVLPPQQKDNADKNYNTTTNSGKFTKGITLTVETADGATYTKTGKSELTIERNKVIDLGTLSIADADEPEEVPADALVLELPMTADALPADFPTATDAELGPGEWDFTIGGKTYKFGFNPDAAENGGGQMADGTAAKPGYYFDTTNEYFVLGSTYGYIQFPAVPDMRLSSVSVSLANKSNNNNPIKYCAIRENPYTKTVDKEEMVSDVDNSARVLLSVDVKSGTAAPSDWKGPDYTWEFSSSKTNTSYCFQSRNGTVQLAKLKLTYVPAE